MADVETHFDTSQQKWYQYNRRSKETKWLDPQPPPPRSSVQVEAEARQAWRLSALSDATEPGTVSTDPTSELSGQLRGMTLGPEGYTHAPTTPSPPLQLEPKAEITDPELLSQGAAARMKVHGTKGNAETLDRRYQIKKKPREFFKEGRVIKILWPELGGFTYENVTVITDSRFKGERIVTKIRWFVVVKENRDSCTCLPISTYNGGGVSHSKLEKWQHSIIYSGRVEPPLMDGEEPGDGERGMLTSIAVKPTSKGDKMLDSSRLCYSKMYTVEHNVKVYDFGNVRPEWLAILKGQWMSVLTHGVLASGGTTPSYSPHITNAAPAAVGEETQDAESDFVYGTAQYNFNADETCEHPVQIHLAADDQLAVYSYDQYKHWTKVYNYSTEETGFVPTTYVALN